MPYDAESDFAEMMRERMEAGGPMATMSDAHSEWHRNAGVPMGQPGCPQDACHPAEDFWSVEEVEPGQGVKCGNRAMHGSAKVYHPSPADVRDCFSILIPA